MCACMPQLLHLFTLRSKIDFFCLFKYGGVKAEVCLSGVQSMYNCITRTAQYTRYLQVAISSLCVNRYFRYVLSRKCNRVLNYVCV